MALDHLTQLVELDRGQAEPVHLALYLVHEGLMKRDPVAGERWTPEEALSIRPLEKLLFRLLTVARRDDKPPPRRARPHKVKVPFDQMTAFRCFYAPLLATAASAPEYQQQLATALARFHQPSLTLESHVLLPAPTGPGAQTALL